ncbi:hypothetical protein C7999DRAFT_28201 [Corynascus novoguineensis]|uniref:Uncharacterized protein n=1 Tax=Corynascus novoguineensis TaxID=1126955 RepID=A0AAN7D1Z2_9PEZI|nr:hypothetical protein C7999DRAFT_28201 [Corynascus novoguineensis]
MEFLIEFYLTTMWTYKPRIVRQVIDDMMNMGFNQAEFTYDNEYSWFRVTCRGDDADGIRQQFGNLAREIEREAFEACEDELLNPDSTLKPSFDNEWFSRNGGNASSSQASGTDEQYCRPRSQTEYRFAEVWDDLDRNDEPYTIMDIMNRRQGKLVEDELNVKLDARLNGKLVHVGGNSEESIHEARKRLEVMLAIKKLLPLSSRAAHIVYSEDDINLVDANFKADIRYLANIDPKLASSTLLDPVMVDNLTESYKTIYRDASSIRICLYAPDKGYYISLLGPKVNVMPRDRTVFGIRPAITVKTIDKIEITAGFDPLEQSQILVGRSQVEDWIRQLPAVEEFGRDHAHHFLGDQVTSKPPAAPIEEALMQLHGGGKSLYQESSTVPAPEMMTAQSAAGLMSQSFRNISSLQAESGMSSTETMRSPRSNELGLTDDDCLIDMLAATDTKNPSNSPKPTIEWGMPPLIPPPSDDVKRTENMDDLNSQHLAVGGVTQDGDSIPISHLNGRYLQPEPTTEYNTGIIIAGGGSFKNPKTHWLASPNAQANQHLPLVSKTVGSGCLQFNEKFVQEIEAAMVRLLVLGPYRCGKVEVRAEFGRIILEGVDPSGLAFNNASMPSDGWTKAHLLRNLNKDFDGSKNISFTKVLSTYGLDISDMVNIQVNGTRLWEENPDRVWLTYSFHCGLRSKNGRSIFIVDIEDHGANGIQFSHSIRLHDSVESLDKPRPLYVHAICRHWDLRIVTSHVKTDELEDMYGAFATNLLRSLSVVRSEHGSWEIRFAVPTEAPADVQSVRVLTRGRYLSADRKSALEITEVCQLMTNPYAKGPYSGAAWNTFEGKCSRHWSQRMTQEKREQGEFPRWYEAAVVSLELENLCQQNALLHTGEKADWDATDLKNRGIFPSVYGPALQMARQMDHVGRLDDNHLSQRYSELLLQGNNTPSQTLETR